MTNLFYYADQASINFFDTEIAKVILVGGDFGYANFGDVLQLKGVLEFYQVQTSLRPIPVYSLGAIPDIDFIDWIKKSMGLNAVLFVSEHPTGVSQLGLKLVKRVNHVGAVHLYGGGFLNGLWGAYVLNVAESFLKYTSSLPYIISGQQISSEIRGRLKAHVDQFQPCLFGVRDFESLERLNQWGINGEFSFDDAFEQLTKLAEQIPATKRKLLIGHINVSFYGGDDLDEKSKTIIAAFFKIRSQHPDHKLVLVNAYNDRRVEVCDSLSSIVAFENKFPYKSYSVIDLASAAYLGEISEPGLLAGEIAISCSYHFTLFMHMAGTPCWLLAQNAYYGQKACALNGEGNFLSFLDCPNVPNYSKRIKMREKWQDKVQSIIATSCEAPCKIQFLKNGKSARALIPFKFKPQGAERLENIILEEKHQIKELQKYSDDLQETLSKSLDYQQKLDLSRDEQSEQIMELRSYINDLEVENKELKNGVNQLQQKLESCREPVKTIQRGDQ